LALLFGEGDRFLVPLADAAVPPEAAGRAGASDALADLLERRQLRASFPYMAKRHFGQNQIIIRRPRILSYRRHAVQTSPVRKIRFSCSISMRMIEFIESIAYHYV